MLRFIALTIIAYFIFRWLDAFFGGGSKRRSASEARKNTSSSGKSRVRKDVGEYIDYEEVKED